MRDIFISDLHLCEKRPDITQALFRFIENECLKSVEKTNALYILGDFFEVWIGDDYSTPLIDNVKDHLKRLTDAGVKLFIMHGNRDFLIGEKFCDEVNATLLDDGTIIEINGEPTLLMHGDTLCTQDTNYLAFREVVRNKDWQQNFLSKPVDERVMIAAELRKKSQESANGKSESIMDVEQQAVQDSLIQSGAKQLIHGHTHRPATHNLTDPSQGTRYVLGDWNTHGWAIISDSSGLTLTNFQLTT